MSDLAEFSNLFKRRFLFAREFAQKYSDESQGP